MSSNLLGICFVVLTSLKLLGKANETVVDEIAVIAIVLFMTSCCFSFLSMKIQGRRGQLLENFADVIFMGGLFLLFVTTLLFAFNIIR
ncbi:MAG: hypothetical protein QM802_18190 [Agriterribacter sp.]